MALVIYARKILSFCTESSAFLCHKVRGLESRLFSSPALQGMVRRFPELS